MRCRGRVSEEEGKEMARGGGRRKNALVVWRWRFPMGRRRTKIVATIGPASSEEGVLRAMIRAGMDVARLNFSHGSLEEHGEQLTAIRRAAEAEDAHVAVLGDLCGPKIRTGRTLPEGPVLLQKGETVRLVPGDEVVPGSIGISYEEVFEDLADGMDVFLADGAIHLRVEHAGGDWATCQVLVGGQVGARKGVNVPGAELSHIPTVTEEDRRAAAWAAEHGLDYLALSFVRQATDLDEVRSCLNGAEIPVLAKIEKPVAVERFPEILDRADGIMVARGDLGVEIPLEEVPIVQKRLCAQARDAERPVIVATQMLETMKSAARPTRAEVSDVANAVFDGADAVMLSAETATGRHPVEAVATMARILAAADAYLEAERWREPAPSLADADNVGEAVGRAAELVARQLRIETICVLDADGTRTRAAAASRPAARILGLAHQPALLRRMALLWGVEPILVPAHERGSELAATVRALLAERRLAQGPMILLTGTPHDAPGPATTLRVI